MGVSPQCVLQVVVENDGLAFRILEALSGESKWAYEAAADERSCQSRRWRADGERKLHSIGQIGEFHAGIGVLDYTLSVPPRRLLRPGVEDVPVTGVTCFLVCIL